MGPGASVGTLNIRYPAYKLQVKTKGRAAPGPPRIPVALALASRLGAALRPPHVSAALAPASQIRVAPVPPRVTWALAPAF
jgi:hypothetical protein